MSEKHTITLNLDPEHPPRISQEALQRMEAMTDEDVHAAALSDPDAQPLTKQEVQRLRRVPSMKAIREHLNLTQEQFSRAFHLSIGTVRDWEQGRYVPGQAARTLLQVIERDPEAVKRALEPSHGSSHPL